ncbi:hypothetical protein CAEBREN_18461 [Caenorhabditis brenneri]|uniref:Uncharacterized protein n=1 Tax=Caenorhabditis brenneri TaxID=135651 RepID=G0P3A7_CAEBE|nr:hypothetical protein CAEBREN_18461 [Caenorhabditis brenneri]
MNSKPLSYDSLKCVILHMEGNKRIELSRRCPSIRMTEKIVPLQLEELGFLKNGFELNRTKYEIGIHQQYHVGETPNTIRRHNESGGYSTDLDSFGLEDGRFRNVLTPGDIFIKEDPWEENNEPLEERIQELEGNVFEDGALFFPRDYAQRNKLIFLRHLHENAPVPFENVFCLKRSILMGSEKVEFYKYNMNYHQAVKNLAMLLFGGRLEPVNARKMIIQQSNVIRLPQSLKIKNILEIDIYFEPRAICEALSEVFQEPNLLLKRMQLSDPRVEDLTTPIIRNAEYINIFLESAPFHNREEEIIDVLTNVANLEAHFEMNTNELTLQDLLTLVRHWKETEKPIGSLLFMMFRTKQLCMERFMDVAKQFDGAHLIEE